MPDRLSVDGWPVQAKIEDEIEDDISWERLSEQVVKQNEVVLSKILWSKA